jgi:hypothetical protein
LDEKSAEKVPDKADNNKVQEERHDFKQAYLSG